MFAAVTDEAIDLGHGVRAYPRRLDGRLAGIEYSHTCGDQPNCPGWIPLKPYRPDGWDLVSDDPLTILPSVHCKACGHHGFIQGGRWVPA